MRARLPFSPLLIAAIILMGATGTLSEAQVKVKLTPAVSDSDLSKEAYVIESSSTRVVAESDGTGLREQKVAIRILADAGVKQFAVLSFAYPSANQSVDVEYVRVRKPDGTVVATPDYNIQDMPADVTRSAPMYSDLHEKHVAVKALGVGDVLEYSVRVTTRKPEVPGQFWFNYSFTRNAIVKEERLEIDIPQQMNITVSSPGVNPEITHSGARRVYLWTSSNLKRDDSEGKTVSEEEAKKNSVAVTTFSNWGEVGAWYAGLQKDREKVTPAIQAKADEITKGLKSDDEKIGAIYKFVALRIHYISLSFGIGRYQPHSAEEVLENEYGDCKDKHTLLTALLNAAGYDAWPVLINSSKKLDVGVPSPAQFDHVITVIPRDGKLLWADTTPEVAPLGLLLTKLRGKKALVIPENKPAYLADTPADPPFPGAEVFSVEGKLDAQGVFTGHFEQSLRGDSEVLFRALFRQVPQAQWKELVQRISYSSGFGGDVSEVRASTVEDTAQPFHVSYDYVRKNYSDWDNRRLTPPLPPIGIEVANDANEKVPEEPLVLGAPGQFEYRSKIELPKNWSVTPPNNVNLVRSYAEYHTSNSFENGVLYSVRRFVIKNGSVPLSEWEDYRKFRKEVAADEGQYIQLNGLKAASEADKEDSDAEDSYAKASRAKEELASIFEEGARAAQRRDFVSAREAFERVIAKAPEYPSAHLNLALVLLSQNQIEEALAQLRKEQEVTPADTRAFSVAGDVLAMTNRIDDAIEQYRAVLRLDVVNLEAALKLSSLLMGQEKVADAIAVLEDTVEESPESPRLHYALGLAYFKSGQKEKGVAEIRRSLEGGNCSKESDPTKLNNIAWTLAENSVELQLAKSCSEKAVALAEARSAKEKGNDFGAPALAEQLAANWDTLGWIYFQLGDLAQAENYIRPSWLLGQSSDVGDHLGQIYERQGKTKEAAHTYKLALAVQPWLAPLAVKSYQEEQSRIRARYEKIAGKTEPLVIKRLPNGQWQMTPDEELSRMRKTRIDVQGAPSASAEFSIVFSPAKVEAVRYVNGAEEIKKISQKLAAANYGVAFPSGSSAVIVRRATVVCTRNSYCDVVLHLPQEQNAALYVPSRPQ
jgi:tetratricopeptide (TPR) repeat protein/transglutaminase-like putative cysteine protease